MVVAATAGEATKHYAVGAAEIALLRAEVEEIAQQDGTSLG